MEVTRNVARIVTPPLGGGVTYRHERCPAKYGRRRPGTVRPKRRPRGTPAAIPPDDPRICPPATVGQLALLPTPWRRLEHPHAGRILGRTPDGYPQAVVVADQYTRERRAGATVLRRWLRLLRVALAARDADGEQLVTDALVDQLAEYAEPIREILRHAGLSAGASTRSPGDPARRPRDSPVGSCEDSDAWGPDDLCGGCRGWRKAEGGRPIRPAAARDAAATPCHCRTPTAAAAPSPSSRTARTQRAGGRSSCGRRNVRPAPPSTRWRARIPPDEVAGRGSRARRPSAAPTDIRAPGRPASTLTPRRTSHLARRHAHRRATATTHPGGRRPARAVRRPRPRPGMERGEPPILPPHPGAAPRVARRRHTDPRGRRPRPGRQRPRRLCTPCAALPRRTPHSSPTRRDRSAPTSAPPTW